MAIALSNYSHRAKSINFPRKHFLILAEALRIGCIPREQTQTAKDEVRSSCPGCWTPDRKAHWRCWIPARRAYASKGCWVQSCSLRPWLRWFGLMGGLGTSNSRNDIRIVRRQALAVAALGRQDLY